MGYNNDVYDQNENSFRKVSSSTASLAKVFGYMFVGILITAAVSVLFSYLFTVSQGFYNAMVPITIVVAILQVILSFFITFSVLKGDKSIVFPGILYCVMIGLLFGAIFANLGKALGSMEAYSIVGMAFGVTALTFGIMSLIALLSKGNLSILGLLGMGLLFGTMIMFGFNFLFMLFIPQALKTFMWISSFVTFAAIMFISIYDIWNIKKICDSGINNKNLELYCAFSIYNDFIAIFIRILWYIVIFVGNSRR